MKQFDLLVAGEINPDLIMASPNLQTQFGQVETLADEMELTIGSSSAIFACGAARLGLKTAFIGLVGDDNFGRFMLAALQKRGVDTSHVIIDPAQKTGLSVILNRGADRAIVTYLGAINNFRADQIPEDLLRSTHHLHVASYFLQTSLKPGLQALFHTAHQLAVTTSLDTNWDPSGSWSGIENLLAETDVFFPNEAEGMSLTGKSTPELAADHLAKTVRIVAMKLGKEGALARCREEIATSPALKVLVADTVGAGDSFDAGFIYGFLKGWSLQVSLRLGTICGSLSTREHGGTTSQADLAEALAYLNSLN
jgi:sugar/nucleoside kinase (ribokinase family)